MVGKEQRRKFRLNVSDHGVEGTGRDACGVSQLRSGFSPLNRQDTASTRIGNVGRPRMRQVWRNDNIRSPQRLPFSLHVPWLRLRHKTPNRWARSAMLFVASTPWTSRNTHSDSPSRSKRRANVPALSGRAVYWLTSARKRAYHARHCPTVGRSVPI